MTLAVVVATGVAAGRVRLAEYRRWRSAPVMARVPIGGRPMHGLERFVSDEMIYVGFWRFPRADIRPPGQRLTGATAVLGLMVRGVGCQGLARNRREAPDRVPAQGGPGGHGSGVSDVGDAKLPTPHRFN